MHIPQVCGKRCGLDYDITRLHRDSIDSNDNNLVYEKKT